MEFEPSYASVLVYGSGTGLQDAVQALERDECVTSCFTAWCPRCRVNYLLTTDISAFPSPSAHHTHQLCLLASMRAHGIYPPASAHHTQQLRLLAIMQDHGAVKVGALGGI